MPCLGVGVGHVVLDGGGPRRPVVDKGGDPLAEFGQLVALDVVLDAGDRLTEVIGGRLSDRCPSRFGGVERRCEGVDLSHGSAAVPAAGGG